VDELVLAVKRRFPKALLQWEDFKKQNAFNLMERYRQILPSFNDDIQGTAAVAVAGILAAGRATGTPVERQRVVIVGAGAAGVGIARQLRELMERAGVDGERLRRAIALLDSKGMLLEGRDLKEPAKREFAWPDHLAAAYGFTASAPPSLLAVVDALRPTVLVGVSGEPGAFNETVVRAMARHVQRPVILPFSNPTSKSEAIPADLMAWTNGGALVATGSPFAPVQWNGQTIRTGQGNNVYIFPGVGLGALVSEARVVTDDLFAAAATALAERVSDADLGSGSLYPPIAELRRISAAIAEAVVKTAVRSGVAGRQIPDDAVAEAVRSAMWVPEYPVLEPV
jgi:malate dehydrogenase (oxaloacetate-decarboxylating)